MAKKKGLGRGLEALLGASAIAALPKESDGRLAELDVDLIERSRFQPRSHFAQSGLEELAKSIRAQGVVQPLVVRPAAGNKFELIAGERRWRAAQLAGLQSVPALIREVDDEVTLALALIENIQREDLTPLEEAQALSRLIEEFDLTHEGAAEAVGRSRAAVSNLLRLLELEPVSRELLQDGALEMGHARALLALSGQEQAAAAREVVARGLSVRQTESLVRGRVGKGEKPSARGAKRVDPNLEQLERELSEQLGTPVHVLAQRGGKGRLVVEYSNLEQLDGILEVLRARRECG